MPKYKVVLRGSVTFPDIEAENEDEAFEIAMEVAEQCMVHDILDDGDVEEIK